ncbi:MAG TPA: hypothetical protein VJ904_09805 [Tichowtungia sp.]|nr:hypothetical protein [Tichowtungia sp.]
MATKTKRCFFDEFYVFCGGFYGLLATIKDLAEKPKTTEQHLNLLFYHYALLQRLRRNQPEAWDEVNELMEDD